MKINLLLFCGFLCVGCGVFEDDSSGNKHVKKYFVHGSLTALTEGAKTRTKTIFNIQDLEKFNDFSFAGGALFYEKSKRTSIKTKEDLEKENAPASDNEGARESLPYSFYKVGDKYEYTTPFLTSSSIVLTFSVDKNDELTVDELFGTPVKAVHYSANTEDSIFSLLLKGKDATGNFLAALYFTKRYAGITAPANVSRRYNYLLGPGVRATWPTAIQIDICGVNNKVLRKLFIEHIQKWAYNDGKIANRDLIINVAQEYAVFSDVNQHCIMLVDDYLFENTDDGAVLGITMTAINDTQQSIQASDIFVSKKGIKKLAEAAQSDSREIRLSYERAVLHEFGHFIGLDHEFDQYDGPSVMSYDPVYKIKGWDKEAVNLLYGL